MKEGEGTYLLITERDLGESPEITVPKPGAKIQEILMRIGMSLAGISPFVQTSVIKAYRKTTKEGVYNVVVIPFKGKLYPQQRKEIEEQTKAKIIGKTKEGLLLKIKPGQKLPEQIKYTPSWYFEAKQKAKEQAEFMYGVERWGIKKKEEKPFALERHETYVPRVEEIIPPEIPTKIESVKPHEIVDIREVTKKLYEARKPLEAREETYVPTPKEILPQEVFKPLTREESTQRIINELYRKAEKGDQSAVYTLMVLKDYFEMKKAERVKAEEIYKKSGILEKAGIQLSAFFSGKGWEQIVTVAPMLHPVTFVSEEIKRKFLKQPSIIEETSKKIEQIGIERTHELMLRKEGFQEALVHGAVETAFESPVSVGTYYLLGQTAGVGLGAIVSKASDFLTSASVKISKIPGLTRASKLIAEHPIATTVGLTSVVEAPGVAMASLTGVSPDKIIANVLKDVSRNVAFTYGMTKGLELVFPKEREVEVLARMRKEVAGKYEYAVSPEEYIGTPRKAVGLEVSRKGYRVYRVQETEKGIQIVELRAKKGVGISEVKGEEFINAVRKGKLIKYLRKHKLEIREYGGYYYIISRAKTGLPTQALESDEILKLLRIEKTKGFKLIRVKGRRGIKIELVGVRRTEFPITLEGTGKFPGETIKPQPPSDTAYRTTVQKVTGEFQKATTIAKETSKEITPELPKSTISRTIENMRNALSLRGVSGGGGAQILLEAPVYRQALNQVIVVRTPSPRIPLVTPPMITIPQVQPKISVSIPEISPTITRISQMAKLPQIRLTPLRMKIETKKGKEIKVPLLTPTLAPTGAKEVETLGTPRAIETIEKIETKISTLTQTTPETQLKVPKVKVPPPIPLLFGLPRMELGRGIERDLRTRLRVIMRKLMEASRLLK